MFSNALNIVKINSPASSILDLIRVLSALTVFLYHFYVPVPGYQAVIVFFVLSGYLISSTVLKSISEYRWSWTDYLIKRITRLWIVLIPCLIITTLWVKLQIELFGGNDYFSRYMTWDVFWGNLFFLQNITVPVYGLNGPLWSLSFEFWYYILFPCLILTFYSKKENFKMLYGVIFLAISFFVGSKIMEYFLIWLLGVIPAVLKPIKFKSKTLGNLSLMFSVILVLISVKYLYGFFNVHMKSWKDGNFLLDLSIGLSVTVLIYIVVSLFNTLPSSTGLMGETLKMSKYLAGFSYTLYLAHYPIANFISAWWNSPHWIFNKSQMILVKPLVGLSIILYVWIVALLTERHTQKVSGLIFKLINGKYMKKTKNQNVLQRNNV